MEVTNGQIFSGAEALASLIRRNEDMPVKYSIRLNRLLKELQGNYQTLIEGRNALIEKYGEQTNGTKGITPQSPQFKEFMTEWGEILGEKVTRTYEKATISGNLNIPPLTYAYLEPFLYLEDEKSG